jgi:F-type H+-transporting ATPase subunit 8
MPQLIPFFFVNQVTYNFLLLTIIIYLFSKYILPRFVRLFKSRVFLKSLESNKNTIA